MNSDDEIRQSRRQHIFAINDDPEFLDVLRVLLQDEAYNVTTTNFVPQTWDQIAVVRPSLLIVDIVPAKQAAWHLLERLHAQNITSRIPIIVTSTDETILERVKKEKDRYGGPCVVVNPLNLDELLGAIHDLIGPA